MNRVSSELLDLLIIGAGPAGYAAAIYAARYRMRHVLLANELGGEMLYADVVENYPGFSSILGPDLMTQMKDHAKSLGVIINETDVSAIEQDGKDFVVHAGMADFLTKTIILATGTERRKLGVPGEEENVGQGVSYCATCDARFFKNRVACVVGGSDSAAKEALVLSKFAKQVHIIYRKKAIRAEPALCERINACENIDIIPDANVTEIICNDDGVVDRIVLDNGDIVETNGVFVDIGTIPRSELAAGLGVDLNESKEIIVSRDGATNVKGIYAAGDVTDAPLKQAITAAADGARACTAAYHYVELEYAE